MGPPKVRKFTPNRVRMAALIPALVFVVVFAGFQMLKPRSDTDKKTSAATSTWTWYQSPIGGGGTAQVIVTDPFNANYAYIGGDSWGTYYTKTAGNDWLPAMKGLGNANANTMTDGSFYITGMAYSKKFPGRVYSMSGRLEDPGSGSFGYLNGDTYVEQNAGVDSGETTATCGVRSVRPRCTGNRVLTDYVGGTEYIYAGTGNGGGVKRSTDEGKTWTVIGLGGTGAGITGMALDSTDQTVLYVATNSDKMWKITNARGAASATKLANAPNDVEEVASFGGNTYAAAATSGMYKVSGGGATWTKVGAGFFPSSMTLSAVGGTGNTVYVGGVNPGPGQSIAKSTDAGGSWTWVPSAKSKINYAPWGTTTTWWLYQNYPRIGLGCFDGGSCTYESTSIAVDQFNANIVYSAGRSGLWKSEDGGNTWRPAVNHLAGTMHEHIIAGTGGNASVSDVDWVNEDTTDHFNTIVNNTKNVNYGADVTQTTVGGVTYKVTLGVPRGFSVGGTAVDDAFFRASVIRPYDMDVSSDGNYVYIALFGGGVVIGHQTAGGGGGTTVAPSVSISTSPATITNGQPSTLSWNVSGTSPTCTASGGWTGSKAASGTQTVNPTATTTYTLACSNSAGSDTKSATVTLNAGDTTAPTVSITAPGNNSTVSGATVAVTANASDTNGIAQVEFKVNGSSAKTDSTSPYSYTWDTTAIANGTYQLQAVATDGSSNANKATATISVTVNNAPPQGPVSITSFTYSPNPVPYSNKVSLQWASSQADGCSIKYDSTTVSGLNPNGTWSSPFNLTGNKAFTLTCTNSTSTKSSTVNVSVSAPPPGPVSFDSYGADPTSVVSGHSSRLFWVTDAASCSVSGNKGNPPQNAAATGEWNTPNLTANITYTINCKNSAGQVTSKPVDITVTAAPVQKNPQILTFYAEPAAITTGQTTTLYWTTQDVDPQGCSITPSVVDNGPPSGNLTTPPLDESTSYTIRCIGGGKEAVPKSTSVTVNGIPAPAPPTGVTPGDGNTGSSGSNTNAKDKSILTDTTTKQKVTDATLKNTVAGLVTLDPSNITDASKKKDIERVEYYEYGGLLTTVKKAPFALDTKMLKNGQHSITERTYYTDGSIQERTALITVNNQPWFRRFKLIFVLPVFTIAIVVAGLVVARRMRDRLAYRNFVRF